MQDRVSTYPGRITLTPVAGMENTYTWERADDPTVDGTPLNKATFLTDAVAAAIGALTGTTPTVPSEALSAITSALSTMGLNNAAKIEVSSYSGTGTTSTINTTFSIHPRIVIFMKSGASFFYSDIDRILIWVYNTNKGDHSVNFSYSESNKRLSRSTGADTDKAARLLNTSGGSYYIVAIGVK